MDTLELQVCVFGKYTEISPTPERFTSMMQTFPGFLPVASQAINIDAISGKVENLMRIQMNNQDTGWRIEIQPDRINAVCSPKELSIRSIDLVDTGVSYIKQACKALHINSDKNYSRLAVNTQIANPSGSCKPPIPFVSNFPNFFSTENDLSEWTVSFNKQGSIDLEEEVPTNEIMTCTLGTSRIDPNQFAQLITIDINTTQNDLRERFGIIHLEQFASYAKAIIQTMLENF